MPMTDNSRGQDWAKLYGEHLAELDRRLAAALDSAERDSLVIFAGDTKYRFRDDLSYHFAVEPYFKAWVPLTDYPGSALKLVPGERPILVLLREPGFWHEPPAAPTGFWVEHFDIREVDSAEAVLDELGKAGALATSIGEASSQTAAFSNSNEPTILNVLDYFRAYKTQYEIACITRANEIAALGHIAAGDAFKEGASEFELNNVYCRASSQTEPELPYPNIVALNEHASILHYQNLRRDRPDTVRSFLIDAGAQCNGYASDITRTYSIADDEFNSLIGAMDRLQQTICGEVRDGIAFPDLNDRAHELLAGVLCDQDLLSCGAEQAYESGITKSFLPHGLGHFLGLQVHDVGGRLAGIDGSEHPPSEKHPRLRLTRHLEIGIAVTIEPGLYFIPSLLNELRESALGENVRWDKIDALKVCGGIRVEDDIVVTKDGALNLSRPALQEAA
ncbi:MAG: Xaa-Pro dipeptidase [Gammaproteobacteria bacterium]